MFVLSFVPLINITSGTQKRESKRKSVFACLSAFWFGVFGVFGVVENGLCEHGRRRRQSDECGSAKHGQRYHKRTRGGAGFPK